MTWNHRASRFVGIVALAATGALVIPPLAGAHAQDDAATAAQRDDRPARQRQRVDVGDDLEFARDIIYATVERENDEPVDLMMNVMFRKDNGDRIMPVVIYIHGGGYSMGSKEDGTALLPVLARGGYFAVSIDYRLSDVAPWPAAAHDCKAAIRFLRANAKELEIDPQRIGVWGHSAGGHLAALIAVSGNAPQLEGTVGTTGVSSAVQCAVDMSGPTDFLKFDRSVPLYAGIIKQFFAGPDDTLDDRMKAASTTTYIDAGDPPIMIVHGTNDNIVPIEHSEMLNDALDKAGVEHQLLKVEGEGHAITSPDAYVAVAEFFDTHLGGESAKFVRQKAAGGNAADDNARPRRDRAGEQPQRPRQPAGAAPQ